jgi:CheY-like chemotaxis protein
VVLNAAGAVRSSGVSEQLGRRIQVLVAEDTATGRAVIREHLDGEGFEVVFAEDGAQAVALSRQRAFDVILMDLRMPVMDGLEAIRTIRVDEGGRTRTPIVVVSANDSAADMRASHEAGADAHVCKPVRRMDILGVVLEFAGRSQTSPQRNSA